MEYMCSETRLINAKERAVILGYDVKALKSNIERHMENVNVFSQAIQNAKREIKKLESYILLIEESKIGNRI